MSKAEGKVSGDHTPSDTAGPTMPRGGSSNSGTSKIVGSQAKRQVTRQGTQKLKFVPTLPVCRKNPSTELNQEEPLSTLSQPIERGRGRGGGRGLGRGRGGPPPPRQELQMTASGPFAMGPAMAHSSKRHTPRSNFAITPMGMGSVSLGEGEFPTGAPVLGQIRERRNKGTVKEEDDDDEVYSDPDEGIQIIDIEAVKTMDWMAPESLRRERHDGKKLKKKKTQAAKTVAKEKEEAKEAVVEKNLANALDLSGSEEEEELEDLIEDFAMDNLDMEYKDSLGRQEKIYFFQFPQPFPLFSVPAGGEVTDLNAMVVDGHKSELDEAKEDSTVDKSKRVSFAEDVKPPAPNCSHDIQEKHSAAQGKGTSNSAADESVDGVIGQLEVHQSGMVKMRFNNDVLMDVTAATQPSFLQHAVLLNHAEKRLYVLGEVNRRFVVSPDLDKLLEEYDKAEAVKRIKVESAMDIT